MKEKTSNGDYLMVPISNPNFNGIPTVQSISLKTMKIPTGYSESRWGWWIKLYRFPEKLCQVILFSFLVDNSARNTVPNRLLETNLAGVLVQIASTALHFRHRSGSGSNFWWCWGRPYQCSRCLRRIFSRFVLSYSGDLKSNHLKYGLMIQYRHL